MVRKVGRVVVFDLDETLGHFSQIGHFYDGLEHYYARNLPQDYIEKLLELYPEVIRPGIISILNYYYNKQEILKRNDLIDLYCLLHCSDILS